MKRTFLIAALALSAAAPASAQQPTATPTRPRFATLVPLYFDFNDWGLRADQQEALQSAVSILQANDTVHINIVGFADERGTAAYNLRLGRRRAAAVKAYLAAHGVASARLTALSRGEEDPVDPGHNEAAWSKNRRVEFRVVGATPLRLPQH